MVQRTLKVSSTPYGAVTCTNWHVQVYPNVDEVQNVKVQLSNVADGTCIITNVYNSLSYIIYVTKEKGAWAPVASVWLLYESHDHHMISYMIGHMINHMIGHMIT